MTVTVVLVISIVHQLVAITSATRGVACVNRDSAFLSLALPLTEEHAIQNANLMSSFTLLSGIMIFVIMHIILLPGVHWLLREDYALAEAKQATRGQRGRRWPTRRLRQRPLTKCLGRRTTTILFPMRACRDVAPSVMLERDPLSKRKGKHITIFPS